MKKIFDHRSPPKNFIIATFPDGQSLEIIAETFDDEVVLTLEDDQTSLQNVTLGGVTIIGPPFKGKKNEIVWSAR